MKVKGPEVSGWPASLAIAAVLGLLAASIAAGRADAQAEPQRGGVLSVGFPSDSKTFDPTHSVQFTERQVLYVVYNTLVRFGPDFSIQPELAESWKIESDGQRIVFKLRTGVKFHDGTDFDAEAVKWNIERRLNQDVASPQRHQLDPIIESVDVIDPGTVAINLKQRAPGLLSLLGERPGFMISPTAAEKFGKDMGNNPVGTGPFVFREWVKGSHIIVERNPNYWEPGKPHLDRIVFRDIAGSVVGAQRLVTGELDFVGDLSPQEIKQLQGRPSLKLHPITVGRWYSLQWHTYEPPFDNAKLRQAIAHGIDRKRINEIVMDGKGTLVDGPTPQGLWWFNANAKSYPHDPDRAKALLAEAGYTNGFEYTLSTPQVGVFQQINQLVQEQLADVGIKLKLEPVAQSEWYDRVVKRSTNMTPTRWTQRPDPDGLLYILFHSKGFANTTGYKNERVDKLLEEGRNTYDQATRKKIYDEAQEIIAKDIPMLSLFYSVEFAALRDNVQGFAWIPDQIPRFRELWKNSIE
jgi:peptide/nickel transport system substrate-binding protein